MTDRRESAVDKAFNPLRQNVLNTLDRLMEVAEQRKNDLAVHADSAQQSLLSMISTAQAEASIMFRSVEDAASAGGFSFQFFSFSYLSRLFFAVGWFGFAGVLNAISSAASGYRNPHIAIIDSSGAITESFSLPDLGHDILPFMEWTIKLPDLIIDISLAFLVLMVVVHPKRLIIIRRALMVLGIVYCMRAFTVIVTSIPDSSPLCQAQFHDEVTGAYKSLPMFPKVLWRALLLMQEPGRHITCGDMIFSGHTTILVMNALIFYTYCRPSNFVYGPRVELYTKRIRLSIYLLSMLGVLSIIASRLHYTLDVFLATLINYHSWVDYHNMVKVDSLKRKFRIIQWLEAEEIINLELQVQKAMATHMRKRD